MRIAVKVLLAWGAILLSLIATAMVIDWLWPKEIVTIDSAIVDLIRTLSWPVVLLAAVAIVVTSKSLRGTLSDLASRLQNAEAPGIKVAFGPAQARETKTNIEQPLQKIMGLADQAYDAAATTHAIRDRVRDVLGCLAAASQKLQLPGAGGIDLRTVRATVHVRDIVLDQSLYQLLDYLPSGSGAGRRFSIRYGAIGLAWRLDERQIWNGHDSNNDLRELMRSWGMTTAEAAEAMKRPFATCLPLKNSSGSICGVLYIDVADIKSVTLGASEDEQNRHIASILDELVSSDQGRQSLSTLGNSVGNVSNDLEKSGTFIKIYG